MATVRVKAARENGRVGFFERHPEHPGGQAFVVGNGQVVEAAETAALKQAIRAGRLIATQATPVTAQTPPTQTRAEPQGIKWIGAAEYDSMNVEDAVAYIRSLSDTERDIAIAYEKRNKHRSGVLEAFGDG